MSLSDKMRMVQMLANESKFPEGCYPEEDVKDFIKEEGELIDKFRNLVLNANTISKSFIEIRDFNYRLNELEFERKKLAGEKLI